MNGRGLKKGTEFVPTRYRPDIMRLSKAALADIAWHLAMMSGDGSEDSGWATFAREAENTATQRGDKWMGAR